MEKEPLVTKEWLLEIGFKQNPLTEDGFIMEANGHDYAIDVANYGYLKMPRKLFIIEMVEYFVQLERHFATRDAQKTMRKAMGLD